jgi:hypothetical protein
MAKKMKFEYVSSTVSVIVNGAGQGDGIVVHVVNNSNVKEEARVIIFHNTGAGAVVATDTGVVDIIPTWQWGLGFTVPQSGEFWVRIEVSSAVLVPKASFERIQNGIWVPYVSYLPGDFAIFELFPNHKRIWS